MAWLNPHFVNNEDGKFLVLLNGALGQHLASGKRWEPQLTEVMKHILSKGDAVIDIGANIGYTTVVMANIVGESGAVYSFEPLRIVFQQLCGNVFLNGLTNVLAMPYALGDVDNVNTCMTPVDYFAPWVNIMDTSVGGTEGEWVVMRTLDSFKFDKISFIKIDVQGFEKAVLNGAKNHIMTFRPVMYVEIEDRQLEKYKLRPENVIQPICDMNYNLIHLKNELGFDFFCVPKEKNEVIPLIVKGAGCEVEIIN